MNDILVAIKYVLPLYIQYELEDNQEYYCSFTHEDWWDLLFTIKVKDDRKEAATQIKKIATTRAASLSDSDESIIFA